MKTIIVNKNFNKKFLSRNIKEIFMPRWYAQDTQNIDTYKWYYLKPDDTVDTTNTTDTTYQGYIRDNQQRIFDRTLSMNNEDLTYNHYNQFNNSYWRNLVGTNGVDKRNYVQPTLFYVVTQSYIDLIDKINTLLYNKQIPLTVDGEDQASHRFLNLMGAFNLVERRKAFLFLLTEGLITQEEYDATALNNVATEQYKWESFSMNYEEINDYYIIKHKTPLKLETRWETERNNVNGEQLYLMIDIPSTTNNNNWNYDNYDIGTRTNAVRFYRADNDQYIYQYSYMAYTLGDLSTNADIQFDHVDKIDYLDSIEVAIKLPRVYN
jgi:hypothetical protein